MHSFTEYQQQSRRTAVFTASLSENLYRYASGMAGEAGEILELWFNRDAYRGTVDDRKLQKEMGDELWYMSTACSALGFDMQELYRAAIIRTREHATRNSLGDAQYAIDLLVINALKYLDAVKKVAEQGHPVDEERMRELLVEAFVPWCLLATRYGFDPFDLAEQNIQKLLKRYPDGFSTASSVNREKTA
jgi:NTP pyrophosphatase (non-canonical NTP hydrolase)